MSGNFATDLRTYLCSNAIPTTGDSVKDVALQSLYTFVNSTDQTGNAVMRIYYARTEQNATLPAIWYEVGLDEPLQTQDGSTNIYIAEVTFGIIARTIADLLNIANALKKALQNFQGQMGSSTVSLIIFQNSQQGFDDETETFNASLTFKSHHQP